MFKRLINWLIVIACSITLISCATSYAASRTLEQEYDIAYILETRYPQLFNYYNENVIRINSVKELILQDGTVDYKINYTFVRYYYDYAEMLDVLKLRYPSLYDMYTSGLIVVTRLYKYVDRNTGAICYNISYRHRYNSYGYDYPYS